MKVTISSRTTFEELIKKSNTRKLQEVLARPAVIIPESPTYISSQKLEDLDLKLISPCECMPFIHQQDLNLFTQAFELSQKSINKACEAYKNLLRSKENLYQIYNNLGVCKFWAQDHKKALKYLNKSLLVANRSYVPYFNLALILLKTKKPEEALQLIEEAMVFIPTPPKDLYLLRSLSMKPKAPLKKVREIQLERSSISKSTSAFSPLKYNKIVNKAPSFKSSKSPSESPIRITAYSKSIASSAQKIAPTRATPTRPRRIKFKPAPKPVTQIQTPNRCSFKSFALPKSTKDFYQDEVSNISPVEKIFKSSWNAQIENDPTKTIKASLLSELEDYTDDITVKTLDSINLTEQEMMIIIDEFDKPFRLRRYEVIDRITSRLHFFSKFDKKVRVDIYKISSICHYFQGETVFKEGDAGNCLYIILKGSVSIEKINKELRGMPIVINSVYDGKQFGDLSLMGELGYGFVNERNATCIVNENSYFLSIPRKHYHDILLEIQREEIEHKVIFFSTINIFHGIDASLLTTFATNIDATVFTLDDIILQQGDVPKGLYIIYSGTVVLYTQGYRLKGGEDKRYLSPYKRSRECRSKTGLKEREKEIEASIIKRALYNNVGRVEETEYEKMKDFVPKDKLNLAREGKDFYILKDWLEFATISSKDFFGGRALLNSNYNLPSKFTIVAKSHKVKVFIIDRSHLQYFTEESICQIQEIISKSFEADCPPDVDENQLKSTLIAWQAYKDALMSSISKSQYLSRHKHNFPFLRD